MTTSSLASVQCSKSLYGNLFLLNENTLRGALLYVIVNFLPRWFTFEFQQCPY